MASPLARATASASVRPPRRTRLPVAAFAIPALPEIAPGPRGRAILRGREMARNDLEASGGAYSLEQVILLLNGVTRQRVEQMVKGGRLITVPGPSNRRQYPVVQFRDDGSLIAGLDTVQAALPTQNPWAILNFLIQPDARLHDRRPIDVLAAGDVAAVVRAAQGYGEPGA